jgi:large subunit ribosomal protein L4
VVFGPKPRSYYQHITPAKRRLALLQALSGKYASGALLVVDKLSVAEPKTKLMCAMLASLKVAGKTLVVDDQFDGNIKTAGRNIQGVQFAFWRDLNAYVVLTSDKILITQDALNKLAGHLGDQK